MAAPTDKDLQAATLNHVDAPETAPVPDVSKLDPDMVKSLTDQWNSAGGDPAVLAGALNPDGASDGISATLLTAGAFTGPEDFAVKMLSYPGMSAYMGKVMNVVCPDGVEPGMAIELTTSAGKITVAVPDGVGPGQEFAVQL
eukprot:gnl/MRDRNA2_/MRDRNA2_159578_c0_seq1.p1 gnl/MRDRNA2_/MRDRNA2_159578_c0~~gnl/MRDRNA2_/MRDRNA2_159578_c0_seq1.p1  ORF type:complete len:142 (-),score=31.99 gnl/MRDRNA2_/MRDRNA2_159578_c0_seq1:46-471(-)